MLKDFDIKFLDFYKKVKVSSFKGKNNIIKLADESVEIGELVLRIKGNNNKIIIGKNASVRLKSLQIIGSNNSFYIGENCDVRGKVAIKGNDNYIKIGDRTTFQGCYLLAEESMPIEIGEDCMFSSNVMVRTSDAHSVIDLSTGARKNKAAAVKIGNRVWVGMNAIITRGSSVSDGSIVGMSALVTKAFAEENVSIAGVPAEILSRNVSWDRKKL